MLLDKTILIRAPPERVFPLLAPARLASWDKSVVRATPRTVGPLHPGDVFDRVTRALGCRFESAAVATSVEEARHFAWRQVEGDFERHLGAFALERTREGTLVHLLADVELPFVLPRVVTESEVRRALSRAADDALFNLKAMAEAAS